MGGTPSSGATGTPTGGAMTTGGAPGTTPTGGSTTVTPTGGVATTSGGTNGMPAAGSGGTSAPAGGTAGGTPAQGGTAAGGTAAGGTAAGAPAAGSGGGGMPGVAGIDPAVFVPKLDGFYWEGTCTGPGADNRQCAVSSSFSPGGNCTVNLDKTFTVMGEASKKYSMEIEVRGLLGSRCYTGGMRRAGKAAVNWTGPNDGLYIGGTVPANWWNTYEVRLMNGPSGDPSVFFLNSYYDNPSPTIEFDAQTCTMEEILEVNYKFNVAVMGNTSLLFRINDQNCQAQMNCGAYEGVKECPTQRKVDLTGMNPPATFSQPPINAIGGATLYPQWAYFDVKTVTEAP